jgi:hypothetical protein
MSRDPYSNSSGSIWSSGALWDFTKVGEFPDLFLGSKARPARRADNLTAICEPTVKVLWDP